MQLNNSGVVTVEIGVNISSFTEQGKLSIYLDLLLAGVVTGGECIKRQSLQFFFLILQTPMVQLPFYDLAD